MSKRVGLLITVRLKSERLPRKALKLLAGKPQITRIIERAKAIKGLSDIALCTSDSIEDRPLVSIAQKEGIKCFCGSKEDVVSRLLGACHRFDLDYFLGVTGDNPLFCVEHSNDLLDLIDKYPCDLLSYRGLPLGTSTYVVATSALEWIASTKKELDTEYWPEYFHASRKLQRVNIEAEPFFRKSYRLTVDEEADYQLMRELYRQIPFQTYLPLKEVIQYLDEHPTIAGINSHIRQRWLPEQKITAIHSHFERCEK